MPAGREPRDGHRSEITGSPGHARAPKPARGLHPQGASAAFALATRAAALPAGLAQRSPGAPASAPAEAPPIVRDVLQHPGTPLDDATRKLMQARLGHDLGAVRVHADERAAASARAVDALAYTVGNAIVFDRGRYAPHDADGRQLLTHELVHTIQQRGATHSTGARLAVDAPDSAAERAASAVADAGRREGGSRNALLGDTPALGRASLARAPIPGPGRAW